MLRKLNEPRLKKTDENYADFVLVAKILLALAFIVASRHVKRALEIDVRELFEESDLIDEKVCQREKLLRPFWVHWLRIS